jgi:hypothetical protein
MDLYINIRDSIPININDETSPTQEYLGFQRNSSSSNSVLTVINTNIRIPAGHYFYIVAKTLADPPSLWTIGTSTAFDPYFNTTITITEVPN